MDRCERCTKDDQNCELYRPRYVAPDVGSMGGLIVRVCCRCRYPGQGCSLGSAVNARKRAPIHFQIVCRDTGAVVPVSQYGNITPNSVSCRPPLELIKSPESRTLDAIAAGQLSAKNMQCLVAAIARSAGAHAFPVDNSVDREEYAAEVARNMKSLVSSPLLHGTEDR